MTLDETIRYEEEQADLLEESAQGCDLTDKVEKEIACKSGKCAAEHRQLAKWLKDYKRLLEYDDAKYHEEHGEVIVDKDVWEDAKKALDATDTNVGKMDGDLINRQAVIDYLQGLLDAETGTDPFGYGNERIRQTEDIMYQVTRLPSVSQEGHWIKDEFGSRCGRCGLYAYRDKFDKPWESPYCPNCGSYNGG